MFWLLLALVGCDSTVDEPDDSGGGGNTDTVDTGGVDADADGFFAAVDCDDSDPTVNPDADEVCDSVDNDCDGTVDQVATDATVYYEDADGDGQGSSSSSLEACVQPEGYASSGDDCDDGNDAVFAGATELCNDVDDDCDGSVDNNAEDVQAFFSDSDGDGFGDLNSRQDACEQPTGFVVDDSDCDDAVATTYPGADEQCNSDDDDCDGSIDEDAVDATTYYADVDGDLAGSDASTVEACSAPSGYVSAGGDCDDADASIAPGLPELCDGIDNDCSSATTEAGVVTFTRSSNGDVTDLTSVFGAGTPTAPAYYDVSPNSGTLALCEGTYYANVDLGGGNIVIEGFGADPSSVVVDGGNTDRVFHRLHQSQTFLVRNLTIQNGFSDSTGAGFDLAGGNSATFESVVFRNNLAVRGGAIWAPGSIVTLTDTTFVGNQADDGGAIAANSSADITVQGGEFSLNSATRGGAFYLEGSATLKATGTVFEGNSASSLGGAGFVLSGLFEGTDVVLGDNTPQDMHADVSADFTSDPITLTCDASQGCVSQ